MAVCRRTVELFYDVLSPYSWVAFEVLCRYRPRWNLDLKFCPFYLAGVMGVTGNRPPGVVPNKAKYMGKDLMRLKEFYGIPLNHPSVICSGQEVTCLKVVAFIKQRDWGHYAIANFISGDIIVDVVKFIFSMIQRHKDAAKVMFEKGSISAMRLLTAANRYHPDKVEQLSREFWMRIWSRDEDIVDLSSIQQIHLPDLFDKENKVACKKAGLKKEESEFLMSKIDDKEIKDTLKETTRKAVDLGAFGAPTIVAYVNNQPHLFFGSDRFLLLAHFLRVDWEGPLRMETPKL